jgi:hypothetical protein
MFCFLLLVTGPERKRERNKGLVKLKFIKGLREEHMQFNNISTIVMRRKKKADFQ